MIGIPESHVHKKVSFFSWQFGIFDSELLALFRPLLTVTEWMTPNSWHLTQLLEHGASNNKVMGSVPDNTQAEYMYLLIALLFSIKVHMAALLVRYSYKGDIK